MVPGVNLTRAETRALDDLCATVRGRFGRRLRELALFGSRARGEGHEHSDLDVLIVVDDLTSAEAREVAHGCGDLLTAYEVLVSPFVVSAEHIARLRSRERLIAAEIARDAVPL
jgi:uncharacterized protein